MIAYEQNPAAHHGIIMGLQQAFPWATFVVRPTCESEESCRLCGEPCPKTGQTRQQELED